MRAEDHAREELGYETGKPIPGIYRENGRRRGPEAGWFCDLAALSAFVVAVALGGRVGLAQRGSGEDSSPPLGMPLPSVFPPASDKGSWTFGLRPGERSLVDGVLLSREPVEGQAPIILGVDRQPPTGLVARIGMPSQALSQELAHSRSTS